MRGLGLAIFLFASMPFFVHSKALNENDIKIYFTERGEAFIESATAHLCIRVDILEFYNDALMAIQQWNNFSSNPHFDTKFHRSYR